MAKASTISARVQAYVEAIVDHCAGEGQALVSVVLFGSAAIGGWAETVSDVDLILVVPDGATDDVMDRLRIEVERIEAAHGFLSPSTGNAPAFERFLSRVIAHDRTFFICTRGDLVSGDIGRILHLAPAQAIFVDRIVLANFVASGITIWGEVLLPLIPVAPVRRFDVFKALFGVLPTALLSAAIYPLHPAMTKFAMGALKGSLHSCFFCYEMRRASLEEEIRFFERRLGPSGTLRELLAFRSEYRHSFSFVVRVIPTLLRLHWRTSIENRFPREVGGTFL
jgi:predicted nucleotidyltransferase